MVGISHLEALGPLTFWSFHRTFVKRAFSTDWPVSSAITLSLAQAYVDLVFLWDTGPSRCLISRTSHIDMKREVWQIKKDEGRV